MSTGKKILQAMLGILLAGAAAVAMGTWVFPEENDLIAAFSGFRVSAAGIGAGLSLLTLFGFADGWIGARNRADRGHAGAGRLWNGLGFGLLPAIAVWKTFEAGTALGKGRPAPEEFGSSGWFIQDGCWLPGWLEIGLAALLFSLMMIWLILRREDLPENGDLMGVGAAGWGTARMVTEAFRAGQIALLGETRIVGWLALAAAAIPLLCWTRRVIRQKRNTGYALACVPVFLVSVTGIALIQNEVLRVGVPIADLILQICFALLALKAVLCLGRVSRN